MPSSQVVITGFGVASPIGIGRQAFRDGLLRGKSGVRRIESWDADGMPVNFGGEIPDFDPKVYVRPRKSLKVMSRDIQLGFTAADLAFADARLTHGAVDPDRIGVVFGADLIYCELDELAASYRACTTGGQFDYKRWGTHAMAELYPLWLLKYLPNMSACHVSIALDARGPSNSITLAEVSSLVAIHEAAEIIRRGAADVMIAGGASCRLHPNVMIFRNAEYMSHRRDDPAAACRPFDLDRDGMVVGEGAGAIVLENRATAEARGAPILAEILGYAGTFEPPAKRDSPASESATARAITSVLRQAKLNATDIGHVSASGLSTKQHDRREAAAICATLGDVPVTATKSYVGNLGAASGAVELAATLVALTEEKAFPTLNYETPDPECPINVVKNKPLTTTNRTAIILSQATPGQSTALAIAGA